MRTRVTFEVDITEAGWRGDRSLAGQIYATPTEIEGGDLFVPGDAKVEVVEPPLTDGVYVNPAYTHPYRRVNGKWQFLAYSDKRWLPSHGISDDTMRRDGVFRIGDLSE